MSEQKAFDCTKCLGFCCSVYQAVNITTQDLKRLAEHFGISRKLALKRYTNALTLKRKADGLLGETCVFFDTEARRCGVYEARPQVCRDWPKPEHRLEGAEGRCCYYDLYQFTKRELRAPNVLPLVQIKRYVA